MEPAHIAKLINEDPDLHDEILSTGGSMRLALIGNYLAEKGEFGVDYQFDYLVVWAPPNTEERAFIYPRGNSSTIWVEGGDTTTWLDMADPDFFEQLDEQLKLAVGYSKESRWIKEPWGKDLPP